jgi:hypothetical protein
LTEIRRSAAQDAWCRTGLILSTIAAGREPSAGRGARHPLVRLEQVDEVFSNRVVALKV